MHHLVADFRLVTSDTVHNHSLSKCLLNLTYIGNLNNFVIVYSDFINGFGDKLMKAQKEKHRRNGLWNCGLREVAI